MKKIIVTALAVVGINSAHADLVTKNDEFRAIDLPPEFRLATQEIVCRLKVCPLPLNFANFALDHGVFKPGVVSTSIEFAPGGPHWPKPLKEGSVVSKPVEFAGLATSRGGMRPSVVPTFTVKGGPSCPRPPKGNRVLS
ncbi:hypothetical protein [Spartinivicinus ruber]|uniref:hypothetical protein n=1 Tax=Spartinivicinus ruber TaxID=2683272 RepID=UPI0013D80076|nr:hypothetical protein [Spartinivicinus ruber]